MRALQSLVLLLVFFVAAPAAAQDTPETRMAAAKRYVAVSDFDQLLEETLIAAARSAGDDEARLIDHMRRELNKKLLMEVMMEALVQTFTTDELNALADFYSSPNGRSIMKKFPGYTAKFLPKMNAEMLRVIQSFK